MDVRDRLYESMSMADSSGAALRRRCRNGTRRVGRSCVKKSTLARRRLTRARRRAAPVRRRAAPVRRRAVRKRPLRSRRTANNPWITFLRKNGGIGLSMAELKRTYHALQGEGGRSGGGRSGGVLLDNYYDFNYAA